MSEEIKKQTRKDSSVDGLRSLADLPQHKRDQVISESMKHAKSAGIDAARIDRGKLNNPEFLHKTANDIETKGAPEDDSAMIMGALAAFAPAILGTLFGGVEVGAKAIEGTIEGAKTGLEAGAKIDELNLRAEKDKEGQLKGEFRSGIVEKDTGIPLSQFPDGRWGYTDVEGKKITVPTTNVLVLRHEDVKIAKSKEKGIQLRHDQRLKVSFQRMGREVRKSYDSHPVTTGIEKSLKAVSSIRAQLASNTWIAIKSIPRALALMSGEQRLTDFDVKNFAEYGPLRRILEAKVKRDVKGNFVELKEPLTNWEKRQISVFTNKIEEELKNYRADWAGRYADKASVSGVQKPETAKELKAALDPKTTTNKDTPKKDTPKTDLETRRQTLEERRDKLIKRRDELLKKKGK